MKFVNLDMKRLGEEEESFERTFTLTGASELLIDSEGLTFTFKSVYFKNDKRCEEVWEVIYTDLTFESFDAFKEQLEDKNNFKFTTNAPLGNRYIYSKYFD